MQMKILKIPQENHINPKIKNHLKNTTNPKKNHLKNTTNPKKIPKNIGRNLGPFLFFSCALKILNLRGLKITLGPDIFKGSENLFGR